MQQVVNEIYKAARKNFPRRRTVLKGLNDLWQTNLMVFIPYSKQNKGYKYIVIVINCFTKYLWARPLKKRAGEHVAADMNTILQQVETITLKNIQSDMGKEYYNKHFEKLMKEYKIKH